MLPIIFLGLIAKLTSVSGDCLVGTQDVKYFDWYEVCIREYTRFLKYTAVKTVACLIFHLWFH
jgi:hypothetical protein